MQGPPPPAWVGGPTAVQYQLPPPSSYLPPPVGIDYFQPLSGGVPCPFMPLQPMQPIPPLQLQQQGVMQQLVLGQPQPQAGPPPASTQQQQLQGPAGMQTSWLIYGPGRDVQPLLPGDVVVFGQQQQQGQPSTAPQQLQEQQRPPLQHQRQQQQPGDAPSPTVQQPEGQQRPAPADPRLAHRRAREQEQQHDTAGQSNTAQPPHAPADDEQQQQQQPLPPPTGGLKLRIILPQRMQQRLSQDGQQEGAQQEANAARTPAAAPTPPSEQQQQQPPGLQVQQRQQQPPGLQVQQRQQQQQGQSYPPQWHRPVGRGPTPSQPQTRLQPRVRAAHLHPNGVAAAEEHAAAVPAALDGLQQQRWAEGAAAGGRPLTRSQKRAHNKRKREEAAAAAAGAFRPPPGLRLRAGADAQDHPEFDFLFGGQHQQQNGGIKRMNAAAAAAAAAAHNQQQQQQRHAGAGRVGVPRTPEQFFCDRADDSNPFWMSAVEGDAVGVLGTVALQAPHGRRPGSGFSMANCELSVVLGPQQLLQVQGGAFVQLWCFKLGDEVPCRVHWPYTNQQLLVNDMVVRPTMAKRLKVGQLEKHQGDLPVDVTSHVQQSAAVPANRLACMARITVRLTAQVDAPAGGAGGYVLGCRLVRPRNIQEVKGLLPPPPALPQAVTELQEKLSGDEDIIAEATSVSIRCAASCVPIQTPANFGTGEGLVCFDLDNFLEMTQKSGKWQCPGTRNFHSWKQLRTSPWMAAVLSSLEEAGLKQTVTDIEVAPDAKWRPTGAPRSCWFDVLEPPTAQQLKDCLRPGAAAGATAAGGGGEAGEVLADSDDEAPACGNGGGRATKRAQQQPQKEVCDLTLTDSEDEQQQQQQQQQRRPAAPAAAASRLAGRPLGGGPKGTLPAAAAAAGGGVSLDADVGAARAAGGNRQQQQQQGVQLRGLGDAVQQHGLHQQQQGLQMQGSGGGPPHRHGYQHKTSLVDWRRQQELVRHAQEQQQQRLVRQGSGAAAAPGSFLAMMQDSGGDSTPPPPPPHAPTTRWDRPAQQQQEGGVGGVRQGPGGGRAHAEAAAAGAAAAAAGGAEGGSGDEYQMIHDRFADEEEYDPLAGYDPTASPAGGQARGQGAGGTQRQGRWDVRPPGLSAASGGRGTGAGAEQGQGGRAAVRTPEDTTTQEEDPWDDVWDDLDELDLLEEDAWRTRQQALQRPQPGQQHQQQQQGKPWMVGRGAATAGAGGRAAPTARPADEPEVIDLVSDSE